MLHEWVSISTNSFEFLQAFCEVLIPMVGDPSATKFPIKVVRLRGYSCKLALSTGN